MNKPCSFCGTEFICKTGRMIYCSQVCGKKAHYEKNRDKYISRAKERYSSNSTEVYAQTQIWKKENKEKDTAYKRKWIEENPNYGKEYYVKNKELIAIKQAKYARENASSVNANNSKHRAKKLKATPVWASQTEIKYIYKLAQERGLVVDHIVPLNSRFVCGLHCEDNLRCIPAKLNRAKGNYYWPDMIESKNFLSLPKSIHKLEH